MQELIKRAKELLADGTVARVLGWKAGDLPYNPEPAYFETEESLKDFVYNGFCGANLSKYMIEASKLEGKTLVCLKPCDTYSFNQLIKEHRVDREKAYIIGVGCKGKLDIEKIRKQGIKKKIQLLIYAPNFVSVIVLCGMVRMFLSPVGPMNKLLGISTNWMTMPAAFRTIYIASGIWQGAGWASIMYTAALSNASKELEEAARMDGANLLQQIWYVELPAIKDIIVIQFILQAGNIMSIGFEKAYALQTDMNLPASEILSTYVYRIGLLNGDYGYSTAVGLFNSVINVILLIFVNWVVKKLNDGEGL